MDYNKFASSVKWSMQKSDQFSKWALNGTASVLSSVFQSLARTAGEYWQRWDDNIHFEEMIRDVEKAEMEQQRKMQELYNSVLVELTDRIKYDIETIQKSTASDDTKSKKRLAMLAGVAAGYAGSAGLLALLEDIAPKGDVSNYIRLARGRDPVKYNSDDEDQPHRQAGRMLLKY